MFLQDIWVLVVEYGASKVTQITRCDAVAWVMTKQFLPFNESNVSVERNQEEKLMMLCCVVSGREKGLTKGPLDCLVQRQELDPPN